jgi:DNA end-binding protein Ku
MVKDPVQDRLMDIIKSKQAPKRKTKTKKTEEAMEPQSNVIDLMAALKKSLEAKPKTKEKADT